MSNKTTADDPGPFEVADLGEAAQYDGRWEVSGPLRIVPGAGRREAVVVGRFFTHDWAMRVAAALNVTALEMGAQRAKPVPATGEDRRFLCCHDPDNETCARCWKHISRHYGGKENRCDPLPEKEHPIDALFRLDPHLGHAFTPLVIAARTAVNAHKQLRQVELVRAGRGSSKYIAAEAALNVALQELAEVFAKFEGES